MTPPETEPPTVFFGVLDWGLGHATRSIPLIYRFLDAGANILLGGCGASLALLRREFPSLEHVLLPSYAFRYPTRATGMAWRVLWNFPSISRAIRNERRITRRLHLDGRIHGIVSDNRYGLTSTGLPSRILTHQLNIRMPYGLQCFHGMVNGYAHRLVREFGQCWLPDDPGMHYAGILTRHPEKIKTRFIGRLSRLDLNRPHAPGRVGSGKTCFLLSGPEPQRSLFEKRILNLLESVEDGSVLVRGVPDPIKALDVPVHVTVYDFADAPQLERILQTCKRVVCRPGYSTLMDLVGYQGQVILVPTPGQTEQEYLARHWADQGWAITRKQHELHLDPGCQVTTVPPPGCPSSHVTEAIEEFLSEISENPQI